ncbi:hypothetical protein CN171_15100 [Sinorhizobium meliloti]|nr:hypothetical protein CN171_15100 [Sinorhizobium meliloti]
MTNIEASIICHPPIPLVHITPLETLVLLRVPRIKAVAASRLRLPSRPRVRSPVSRRSYW